MYLTYLSYITVDKIFGLKAGNKINMEQTRLFCKKKIDEKNQAKLKA